MQVSQVRKSPIKSLWELATGVNRVLTLCYKNNQIDFYSDFSEDLPLFNKVLKADRPHLRYYPCTLPDYRHTDEHLRLVMTMIALCCTRQSQAPNIDCCMPKI